MQKRHKKLFKNRFIIWLVKRRWGKKLLLSIFGNKKADKKKAFPSFIKKTDEERVESIPWVLEKDDAWILTEKLDGTSCTYAAERKGRNKFEFYICSRNMRITEPDQNCYHSHNIYYDLATKYNIKSHLISYLSHRPLEKWVCIQGEGVGKVQGNPLKLKDDDLFVFNFITEKLGRFDSFTGEKIVKNWGIKWVPILGVEKLPKDMQTMKEMADGKSQVNPSVLREGIVYRSLDGKQSFKNVSNEYLIKKGK